MDRTHIAKATGKFNSPWTIVEPSRKQSQRKTKNDVEKGSGSGDEGGKEVMVRPRKDGTR